ncbi:MAG: mechanosensitive ion channel family protein [Gemmatimonadota bacterium]|nr:mechanosensitive ion channel family protein [Gemmatimonadota bacterium]
MENILTQHPWLGVAGALAILALLAWAADRGTKRFAVSLVRRLTKRTRSTWDDRLVDRKVFARIAHFAPALVVYYGIGVALGVTPDEAPAGTDPEALGLAYLLLRRVALAYMVLTGALAFHGFLSAVDDIYRERYEEANNRPIKGYLQVLAIFVYVAAGIVIVSILADRSPVIFLSGLGALTAVLLLVFRDTILSLVASVQIMSNDMIRIGDWVEMPQAHADGDVIDIALHTVTVQNWDKTYTMIPTHRFISDSFRNWRGMQEAGGRRIKRPLYLDVSSVRFLTDEEIDHLGRYEFLADYMKQKRQELAEANARTAEADGVIPERRRLTNVGTFRAYALHYLKNHSRVRQDLTLLVRQLPPGPEGLPLEIYCFANETAWATYESIQADIFDHLLAILPEFGLRAYQKPAGRDLTGSGSRVEAVAGAVD